VKKIVALLSLILIVSTAIAQKAKISGKITNTRNESLAGVTVKAGTATAQSNIDGQFTISVDAGKNVTITFSYVGYQVKTISDLNVKANTEEIISVLLEDNSKKLDEVVVKSSNKAGAKGETVNALIAFQKNTNTVASVISAEAIRRSPDRNTGEVLKRTPGASIQDGKFLIVRGLADRYNAAMLNGVLLASTEPDRKAFSFDLIPANMIDNIIINKAFVPELPGEWAGGLVQVNTRDIPSKNFFNIQLGTGVNTQAHFDDYYAAKGGKTDWLGLDDGTRNLPASYTTKSKFDALSASDKIAVGKQLQNVWSVNKTNAPLNAQLQMSGGFNAKLKGQSQIGGILGITYNSTSRLNQNTNNENNFNLNGTTDKNFAYNENRYAQDVLWGAVGAFGYQINNKNKISVKSIFNVSTTDYATVRSGVEDFANSVLDSVKSSEIAFKQNILWNTQVTGEHSVTNKLKLKWYGSFNVLDNFIPDQRRISYNKDNTTSGNPYRLLISNTLSQSTGNRFFQNLNDYTYTAGGDVAYGYKMFGYNQTLKVGYMFQVRDRLFDAKPFSIYLPKDNAALRLQDAETIFSASNFGDGAASSTLFAFDAIKGSLYRYVANTILNAGFIQFDNQLADKLRIVWGLRVENYDQLVGSVNKNDPRHSYSVVRDILPGLNATYKLNTTTNIRLSASQTVVRPEFRELASFQYFDFDLNASVQGNPALSRTKITNVDVRYELYPNAGEVVTVGAFYKHFQNPIEAIFSPLGGGSYNFQNPPTANVFGAELELRKKLDFSSALKNFTVQANLAYINSKVKDDALQLDRPLQGQSPYIINLALMYDLPKAGLTTTLLFNQIGKRIAFVGNVDKVSGIYSPDIYEASRPVLDYQITKKIIKNKAELRLNISDILNKRLYFYQNNDGNTSLQKATDTQRFTRQFGTSFSLTFGYTL
jgi:TonB-dependent receptor